MKRSTPKFSQTYPNQLILWMIFFYTSHDSKNTLVLQPFSFRNMQTPFFLQLKNKKLRFSVDLQKIKVLIENFVRLKLHPVQILAPTA